MEEIVGLNSILDKIDTYSLDTLPHSIILLGKEGSGKHVISKYIGCRFSLDVLDISENLSEELIYNIYRYPSPRLYLVDLRLITEKEQNILLKLFEEPSSNTFVVLLANSSFNVLPTILNRGHIINIGKYSVKELSDYAVSHDVTVDNRYLGTVIETPGDIQKIYSNNIDLGKIEELTTKILTKLDVASYANTLTIVDKLNFKDEYDKIDVDFFLKVLYYNGVKNYELGNNKTYKLLGIIENNMKKFVDSRLNKRILVSHMLSEMWLGVRE